MIYNPFSLENKTILITGASSGIGRSAAIECAKLGAKVIITARNEERLKETFSQLIGDGHQMVLCDLAVTEDLDVLVEQTPTLNGLISNAGFTKLSPIQFVKETDLKSVLQVNTIAPILLLQKLLKKKKFLKGSSIVFTSSLAGLGTITPGNSMYATSKGAICTFIKAAALELASKQIRVNSVCPGMIHTNILNDGTITEEQMECDVKNYPLGRYGKPEDVAYAMIYLLSEASSWVTGSNFIIDGGLTLK